MLSYISSLGVFALPLFTLSTLCLGFSIERFFFWRRVLRAHKILLGIYYSADPLDISNMSSRFSTIPLYKLIVSINNKTFSKDSDLTVFSEVVISNSSYEMKNNHDSLNLLSVISPSIGLLGTVVGLMSSFDGLSSSDQLLASSSIAAGVSQALGTTVFGLLISIVSTCVLSVSQRLYEREVLMLEKVAFDYLFLRSSNDV